MLKGDPLNPAPASPAGLRRHRSGHHPIRPWPSLPSETQMQMAQLLAELLRRMHPIPPPSRENINAERHEPF
jgi:aminoglycoside phosphotransferase (APT) family kinase protein